jgi:hypothetical protein
VILDGERIGPPKREWDRVSLIKRGDVVLLHNYVASRNYSDERKKRGHLRGGGYAGAGIAI